jgi:hypothetical protein
MRTRQLLPALAGALALTLPAAVALGAGGPPNVGTAPAPDGPDLAAVAAADSATTRVIARIEHRDAVSDVLRLSRRRAHLAGAHAHAPVSRHRLVTWSTPRLRSHQRRLRASVSELRRTGGAPDVAIPAALHAIAQCESGGNPAAVDSSGTYRGLFQFDRGTWASVGGSGDPAAAPAEEQYRRAAMLYARSGASPWPVCGR